MFWQKAKLLPNRWTVETCSSPDNCGHTINNWVESRWHNLQTVISVRALEHQGEFHREPPHPNKSYKHICGYLWHLLFNLYRVSQISPPFRIYCWHVFSSICLYPSVSPGINAAGWSNTKLGRLAASVGACLKLWRNLWWQCAMVETWWMKESCQHSFQQKMLDYNVEIWNIAMLG